MAQGLKLGNIYKREMVSERITNLPLRPQKTQLYRRLAAVLDAILETFLEVFSAGCLS